MLAIIGAILSLAAALGFAAALGALMDRFGI